MKFSESWLREWVNPKIDTQTLVDQLTMAGLEVDAVEAVAGEFSGVVVGEILEVEQHPDAEKLRVCRVAGAGEAPAQIVCGAPNARAGIKIPFATIGAKLPGNFKIKKAKLRGVESFGMLCAQTELQAGDDDDGLWELPLDAPVGTDLREYLALNDTIIEVDLTPNRSDCLSLKGLAREAGVLNRETVKALETSSVAPQIDETFAVELVAPNACPRYAGRVIRNVNVKAQTPLWMVEKLRRSGIRSIDPVVDVTNFILLEQGQPMHAFDLNKLNGKIIVRMAEQGEKITLLDEKEVQLNADTLVIADEKQALAIAGVMGGLASSVTGETQDIFLESAFFQPIAIAGKARSYGLHTDSSHRFERGVDYAGAKNAIERATRLLLDIVGGEAGPVVVTEDENSLPTTKTVTLKKARIQSGLGFELPDEEVIDILERLGLQQTAADEASWTFSVPSYRFDISIEEDLLEELARIYGYNNLPVTQMRVPAILPTKSEAKLDKAAFVNHLVSRGFQEVITYSFIDPALHKAFDKREPIALMNPISADLGVMRTSLIPGLVKTLQSNLNRQHEAASIFETGLRFEPTALEKDHNGNKLTSSQTPGLAALIYGPRNALSWQGSKDQLDFYDLKGHLASLLDLTGQTVTFQKAERDYLHPGQTAEVLFNGNVVGVVGALHPSITKQFDIPKSAYVFELSLNPVLNAAVPEYQAISKFPSVTRDLAVVIHIDEPVASVDNLIRQAAGENLKNLKVFDVYSGEGIEKERKSVAFNLTFQHSSRTLNEDEINASMEAVVSTLEEKLDAKLR